MSLQGNFGAQQGSLPGVSQLNGLGRQGWQQLVASATGPGVNAAQAAVDLDPFYRAQRENRGQGQGVYNVYGQDFGAANGYNGRRVGAWQEAIRQVTQQYGVNAAQAAQMLDPYWQGTVSQTTQRSGGRRRSRSRSGSQGGIGQQGLQQIATQYGAANGLNGATNGLNGGTASGRAGLESGFGMYEGQRSPSQNFRGGTPAESTDVVMDNAESAGMSMLQAATSPARITNRSGQTFNEVDIARIAQALGIQTQGLNRAAMIAAIKAQTGGLSPRSQAQFLGSQSPRSQQFLGSLATQRTF